MKTRISILATIGFILVASIANAEQRSARLTLRTTQSAEFTLVLNHGQAYNFRHQIQFPEMRPGRYYVQVFKKRPHGNPHQNGFLAGTWLDIPAGMEVNAIYKAHHLYVDRVEPMPVHCPPVFVPTPCPVPVTEHLCYVGDGCLPQMVGMYPDAFQSLRSTLLNISFDNSRLQIAKQAVYKNKVSAAQVESLLRCFTFESTKLEFAKYAYQYTADPQNYYIVNDAFSFSSSVDELAGYLNWN